MHFLEGQLGSELREGDETDARYRLLFERNPQPIWVHDAETLRFIAVNDAALEQYGYTRAELREMSVAELWSPPESFDPGRLLEPALGLEAASFRHRTKRGAELEVNLLADDLPFRGRRARLVVATDVTATRRAQRELDRRARQQAAVAELGGRALEGAEVGPLIDAAAALVAATLEVPLTEVLQPNAEREGLVLRAGVGWGAGLVRTAVVPLSSANYAGWSWNSPGPTVVRSFATEPRFEATELLREHGVISTASVIIGRASGPLGLLGAHATAEREFSGDDLNFLTSIANVIADVIERRRVEDRIRHQALHDPLTGLANRTLLINRLNHWLRRAERRPRRGAVIFLDLDNFKPINDGLGHEAGDTLLLEVARRLRRIVRPSDTVARAGGDEFILLCEDVPNEPAALAVVDRLVGAFERPFSLSGAERRVTASIGLALAAARDGAEALVRDADAAMYRAKENGRARFELFDERMRERTALWLRTEEELRQGLERGEFHNVYQPVVSSGGETVSLEALVRWSHPTRGEISPADFIPVAEQSGLIVPLGRGVLLDACREAAGWERRGEGEPPSISVNLSPRQVASPGLVQSVAEVLAATGLAPERLELEITENVLIQNTERALAVLEELKALGVGLVLDDFGTGYSSLGYVKQFPIDVLKIDRSFIRDLSVDPEDGAIVSAVLSMGQALGIEVIAEGVETDAQAKTLASLGCKLAQGFLFARPMPPEDVAELVAG